MTAHWSMLWPQLALTAGLMSSLGLGMLSRPPRLLLRLFGAAALLSAVGLAVFNGTGSAGPLIRLDAFALIVELLACLGAVPLILLHDEDDEVPVVLALGCVLGITLLAASDSLIMLFISLELMSLPAYLLAARGSKASALEAGVKYFFAGSVAGSLFLMGTALHYAASRSLVLAPAQGSLAAGGVVLMGCAALFKLGAAPLHFWLPDVYEACEPETAAFFSTSMKAGAALLLIRLAALAPSSAFAQALPWVGGATVLFGSLLALRQQSLQRLFAYSSISHAGFLVLGIGAGGARVVFFYLAVYLFMSSGVFLWLKFSGISSRSALRGYARGRAWSAAGLSALLVCLAGMPPTGGFLAKLLIFWRAVEAGLYWPVALAGLGSLVSIAYYLGLIQDLYSEGEPAAPVCGPGGLLVGICAVAAVLLGLAPAFAPALLGVLR